MGLQKFDLKLVGTELPVGKIFLNNTRHASPRKRTRAGFLLPAGGE